jgi:2-polyprenyl-3-methyl-5-hydroxy-6-metoxy-1,4-benzoquinol methylase
MGRLDAKLSQAYFKHYARINRCPDPAKLSPGGLANFQLMYGELVESLPARSRVLDLGCGTGFLLRWLSSLKNVIPVGVDASQTQVEALRSYLPGVEVHCADGLDYLKGSQEAFGGIFCTDVLEHLPSEDMCLVWIEAVRASLTAGGFFVCQVPNAANLTGFYSRCMDLTHHRAFTSSSLLQLLETGGLEGCTVMPMKYADIKGKMRRKLENLLHSALYRICSRERDAVYSFNVIGVGYRK